MGGKKSKKVEEELVPEEMVPVERDFDAEQKDAEVMKDEDIPPANVDKMWRHISPRKVFAADLDTALRLHLVIEALKGYGISQNLFEKFPADLQALFNDKLVTSEEWTPGDNL